VMEQPTGRLRARALTVDALSLALSQSVSHQLDHFYETLPFGITTACLKKTNMAADAPDRIRYPALTPFL
jgi:hypothetical protein